MSDIDLRPTDLTAFSDGVAARIHDNEEGGLTDCPYAQDSVGMASWYRGYNYDDDHPEEMKEIRKIPY